MLFPICDIYFRNNVCSNPPPLKISLVQNSKSLIGLADINLTNNYTLWNVLRPFKCSYSRKRNLLAIRERPDEVLCSLEIHDKTKEKCITIQDINVIQ